MALDLSIEPFFDDYSEDKKFHRILFRPGYAVQARELTQMQTILQEQIRRHGDHIFKEGAMVIPGQVAYDVDLGYVTVLGTASALLSLSTLTGKVIKNSAGLLAVVISHALKTTTDPDTIFVKYLNSIQNSAGNNVNTFLPNDVISTVDNLLSYTVDDDVTAANSSGVVVTIPPIGTACSATIARGVYYIKKNFVLVTDQTIILDKYTNTPSYRIGLQLSESVVYPEDDESLLDNALGSPNYSAPGSARYYMDLVLSKKTLTDTQDSDFIELLRLNSGKVTFKIDRTLYAEIEKTLARRTYDESGDYTLSPFTMSTLEFRNNLRGDWAAGEKFVQGDLIKVPDGALGFYYFVATTNGTSGSIRPTTFTPTVDYVTDNTITWEFMVNPNFNRGVNTFTAGDPLYSAFTINDHIRLNGMIAIGIEAGKAYVRGYEIAKISTEYVPVYKSRSLPAGSTGTGSLSQYFNVTSLPAVTDSLSAEKTASIDLSSGSYIICNTIKYVPNVTTFPAINLHSAVTASAVQTGAGSTVIGTARIRGIERHDGSNTDFKVFLFDIKMNTGKDFVNTKSLGNSTTSFSANAIQVSSQTILDSSLSTSLIYSIPQYAVATVTELDYSVVVPFTRTSTGGTTWDITAPTGYTFESVANASTNYILSNDALGTLVSSPTLVAGTGNASLQIQGLTAGYVYSLLATMKRANVASPHINLTVTDDHDANTTSVTATPVTIVLSKPFVTRIVSVMMDSRGFTLSGGAANTSPIYNTDITNRYSFNSEQYTTHAGKSTITLLDPSTPPTGPIDIKYEYLALGSVNPGGIFDVNSYTHSQSKIIYDQIFMVSNYALRDSLDFRPVAAPTDFIAKYLPKYGSTASVKYIHHLERIDNISLSTTGDFIVSRGIPSITASEPKIPNNTMKLATLAIEPYTFNRDNNIGLVISRTENKRYTMRDIGRLERRIQDLEYYTALTLSEIDTSNMRIVDSNGLDRFQNGFLVDSFNGQGIGNVASEDWNASIDSANKELRPFFSQKQVTLVENVSATTRDYKVSGDLVTLPFTEVDMIVQDKASMSVNLNPYDLYSWKGIVDINPWSDTWFSTTYRPDIVLNDEGQYNALVAKAEQDGSLGTVWNAWQVVFASSSTIGTKLQSIGAWSQADTEILSSGNNGGSFWRNRATFTTEELAFIGATSNLSSAQSNAAAGSRVVTIETTAVETQTSRTGTRTFITDKVDSRILEDRIVDTSLVPYIRPRAVLFTGYGFKPGVAMNAFFDNTLVNDYITPVTRIEITAIDSYSSTFDVTRNAGSAVSDSTRTVFYSDGATVTGTVALTNNSNIVTGTASDFLKDFAVGDTLNIGTNDGNNYTVTEITGIYSMKIKPVYAGASITGVSVKVQGPKHTTQEVEVAFNHGEVIKEYVNGVATGNTAIVVGQEIVNTVVEGFHRYIFVMNIKGNGQFSTATDSYLIGEYNVGTTTVKPRVKFLNKTNYSQLITTGTGLLLGTFRIPSNPSIKFRTGIRELRFSDDFSTVPSIRTAREQTGGGALYEANGYLTTMQRTIVSTRTATLVSEQTSDNNTVVTNKDTMTRDTGWFDPLAQTFMVQQEGGAFITSVDLFFETADPKIPVRIEIREVVNGYPGSAVLPFSRVEKKGASVLTSANATVATTFKFTSPVFVQNGVEYALVALSDCNSFRVHISQTDTVMYDGVTRISSQPYNGVLFKSQNASTWTADQTQDMKFTIRRAQFSSTPLTIEFIPPPLGMQTLGFNPFNLIKDSRKCRVVHKNHGMRTGNYVKFISSQVIDSINAIPAANIFNINLQILAVELDAYVVEFAGTIPSSATGRVGGGFIKASENYEFETAMIEMTEIVPPGTSISYVTKVINHAGVAASYPMIPKTNITFEEEKVYPSLVNYTNSAFPTGLSVTATLTPSSTLDSVSPVIDVARLAMTMVSNKIDSPDLTVNDSTLDYFPITTVGSPTQIGSGKPFTLVSDTLVVNSTSQPTLFTNLNNNVNSGDVIRFVYSAITNPVRNMVIVEKSQDSSGNLFLKLESFDGTPMIVETTTNTVAMTWLSHFRSEYAASGGSTHSKYVTKKINFSRPSDMLKIMFAAIIPPAADVEIYYKTGASVSGDFIASRYYKLTPDSGYVKSETEFTDITASVENLSPFDSVIIKLVMKSINKSKVPRIKNFRVISCAAA